MDVRAAARPIATLRKTNIHKAGPMCPAFFLDVTLVT